MANHEIDTICPNCGHEYDAHLHWLVCPECGHRTKDVNAQKSACPEQRIIDCLCCPNCFPPSERVNGLMCGYTKTIRPDTDAFGLTDQEEADILKQWEDGKKIGCIAIDLGLPADDVIEFLHYQGVI